MKIGKNNLITDVKGVLVGNSENQKLKSGVTVFSCEKPFKASVTILGGAPGTKDTDLLETDKLVEYINALVLSGGSVYGLDAPSGVVDVLREEGKGYKAREDLFVPIVPGAIIFDLVNGGKKNWKKNPYYNLGKKAYLNKGNKFKLGSFGAGTGATSSTLKGGLGSSSFVLNNGSSIGALVAVNPFGSVVMPGSNYFWAAPYEVNNEFGGKGLKIVGDYLQLEKQFNFKRSLNVRSLKNSTIAIVATDYDLTKSQLKRISVAAHDGFSRSIVPVHTPFDGDLIFSVSTGENKNKANDNEEAIIGHLAGVCVSRAIARGVYEAKKFANDISPTWKDIENKNFFD